MKGTVKRIRKALQFSIIQHNTCPNCGIVERHQAPKKNDVIEYTQEFCIECEFNYGNDQ
jgi:hypothetical protein